MKSTSQIKESTKKTIGNEREIEIESEWIESSSLIWLEFVIPAIVELFRSFDNIIFIIKSIETLDVRARGREKEKKIEGEKPIMNYELQKPKSTIIKS